MGTFEKHFKDASWNFEEHLLILKFWEIHLRNVLWFWYLGKDIWRLLRNGFTGIIGYTYLNLLGMLTVPYIYLSVSLSGRTWLASPCCIMFLSMVWHMMHVFNFRFDGLIIWGCVQFPCLLEFVVVVDDITGMYVVRWCVCMLWWRNECMDFS